jgi:hypothetical protein
MSMSIPTLNRPWRSPLIALIAGLALAACSKPAAHHDHADGDHAGDRAPARGQPPMPPEPHGGHDASHGGMVLMDAEHHVELVLDPVAGAHRLYVSDGARAPLPASTFDAVTLTVAGEVLAMTRADDDRSWQVTGRPAPATGARVSLAYTRAGKEVGRFDDLAIEYVLTGVMPRTPADDHDHDHAEGDPRAGASTRRRS